MTRPTVGAARDERIVALRRLTLVAGSVYDSCTRAASYARQDADEESKALAIVLELRRVERLADELKRLAASVPR
jgi:hypothetical protein